MTTLTPEQQEKNRKLCGWIIQRGPKEVQKTKDYEFWLIEGRWITVPSFYESWDSLHACLEKLTSEQLKLVLSLLRNFVQPKRYASGQPRALIIEEFDIGVSLMFRATKSQWIDALCEGLNL